MNKNLTTIKPYMSLAYIILTRVQKSDCFSFQIHTYKKRGCLTSARLLFEVLGNPLQETDRVNTHAGEYSTPVKCAYEDMVRPRSTLRRVYTTPRGVTSAFVLACNSKVPKFRTAKNKASVTPFQYVVSSLMTPFITINIIVNML